MEYSFPLFVDGRCDFQREIFTHLGSGMYVKRQEQIQETQIPSLYNNYIHTPYYMYMVQEFFWTILDAIVTKSTMSSEKEPPGHQDLYRTPAEGYAAVKTHTASLPSLPSLHAPFVQVASSREAYSRGASRENQRGNGNPESQKYCSFGFKTQAL